MEVKKVGSFVIIFVLVTSLMPVWGNAADLSYGSSCPKIKLTKIYNSKKYVCLRINKKMIWTVEQTQGLGNSETNGKNSNSVEDFVDFRRRLTYGIKNDKLTRLSSSGIFFEKDSRKIAEFDPIRVNAYNQLHKTLNNITHPNVDFTYVITNNFPKNLIDYNKRELDEAAAIWNQYFRNKINVNVYFVTEKDRIKIKENSWMDRNLQNTLDRLENKGERPFIAGGADYWDHNGSLYGELYLATASDLNLNYVNYEWPEVAKHEFTHIVQGYFYRLNGEPSTVNEDVFGIRRPLNFIEGSANSIGYLSGFGNIGWSSDALDWELWQLLKDKQNFIKVDSALNMKKLIYLTEKGMPQEAFELSYAVGGILYEYFLGNYGLDKYVNLLEQTGSGVNFDTALKNTIGISRDEFYTNASAYIYSAILRVKPYA